MIPARANPFASDRIESLAYRFPGFQMQLLVDRLAQRQWRGAIVGRHGSGKTTLLIEIARCLQNPTEDTPSPPLSQLWFIPWDVNEQNSMWPQMADSAMSGQLLLVDGIERLSWSRQLKLVGIWPFANRVQSPRTIESQSSGRARIIVTAHRPTGLPTLIRCQTSQPILQELVKELHPDAPTEMLKEAERLFATKRGNIRDVFWQLYDRCSGD